jgi:hypothetical protein
MAKEEYKPYPQGKKVNLGLKKIELSFALDLNQIIFRP